MASVYDVAAYILDRMPGREVSAMKLQKLVYYAQAWHLVWAERQLFGERFEAWAGGPVCPDLYIRHRRQFIVDRSIVTDGNPSLLDQSECETVDRVIGFYGQHSAQWLSDLTHLERPWLDARTRAGVAAGATCQEVITAGEMAEYYSGLMANAAAQTIS